MCCGEQIKISKEEGGREKEIKKGNCVLFVISVSTKVKVLIKHYHDDMWAVEIGLLHQAFLTSALVGVKW